MNFVWPTHNTNEYSFDWWVCPVCNTINHPLIVICSCNKYNTSSVCDTAVWDALSDEALSEFETKLIKRE